MEPSQIEGCATMGAQTLGSTVTGLHMLFIEEWALGEMTLM